MKRGWYSVFFWCLSIILMILPVAVHVLSRESVAVQVVQSHVSSESSDILVHVIGAVMSPGVYRVPVGTTVQEVLNQVALTDQADMESINLAKLVRDGQQLKVKKKKHLRVLVNINLATVSELMTVPGIGKKKAQAIVAYRDTNGSFNSLDDLLNIEGIGTTTLNRLRLKLTY